MSAKISVNKINDCVIPVFRVRTLFRPSNSMIDLLHVDLTSFLAGGANFLRTKIKSLIIIQIQEALIGENLTT